MAGVAAFLVIAVLVALAHPPSQAERASDMRGFLHDMTTDIESCAGGVGESLTALRGIESGSSNQVADAIKVARDGAANCQPANSMQIDDLISYQVTESLASFHLARAVSGLALWASLDAVSVQTDVANLLAARGAQARTKASAALQHALRTLDTQRTAIYAVIGHAISSLGATATPPRLPG